MPDPRRLGRPPLDEDDLSVPLTLSLPSKQLAILTEMAHHARCTNVQELIRRFITACLERENP